MILRVNQKKYSQNFLAHFHCNNFILKLSSSVPTTFACMYLSRYFVERPKHVCLYLTHKYLIRAWSNKKM